MASQQQKKENKTQEREIHVEKDSVPKLGNRFEGLAKATEAAATTAAQTPGEKGRNVVVVGAVGRTGGGGGVAGQQKMTESGKVETGTHFDSIHDNASGLEFGVVAQQGGQHQKASSTSTLKGSAQGRQQGETTGLQQQQQKASSTAKGSAQGGQEKQKASLTTEGSAQSGQQKDTTPKQSHHEQLQKASWTTKQTPGLQSNTHEQQKQQKGISAAGEKEAGSEEGESVRHHQQQQEKNQTPSLEEISKYRQTAQQNSIDELRAAEERYAKAKQLTTGAMGEAKEAVKYGAIAAANKASQLGYLAQTKAHQGVEATTQYVSDKTVPVKETATEKAKEALSTAGHRSMEYTKQTAGQAQEYAAQKAEELKTGAQRAGVQARDTTVSTTKSVADYVGDKAAAAKDVAVDTGKTAAEYAGKVAEDVKDQTVAAGWGAAHYTTELAVGATKMAGGVVSQAKDVVASAAQKATELAEKPVVMAKDTAIETGERAADYTARKKMEAERYKDEKQSHYSEGGTWVSSGEGITEKVKQGMETTKDKASGAMEGLDESLETVEEKTGGMLGAIGETLVEIAQHTTELVAGGGGTGPAAQVREEVVGDRGETS